METVFVALEDIAFGDPVEPHVLKLEKWPASAVPDGALTKIEDIEGRRARTEIFPGEPILDRKLLPKGQDAPGSSMLIPKGMRVVSVKVDDVSTGGGLILPGDRVDVVLYLKKNPCDGIAQNSTIVVLQDVKVFAVDDQFKLEADEGEASTMRGAKTVSLLVTPGQAQKVMLSSEMGKIRLVLRSPEDETQSDKVLATTETILSGSEVGAREKECLVEPEPDPKASDGMQAFLDKLNQSVQAQQPAPQGAAGLNPLASGGALRPDNVTWNMRVVRAGSVEDVTLEKNEDPKTGKSTWTHTGMGFGGGGGMMGGGPAGDGYAPFTPPGAGGAPPAGDPDPEPTEEEMEETQKGESEE
jgi:pilus assembly protein CpaB